MPKKHSKRESKKRPPAGESSPSATNATKSGGKKVVRSETERSRRLLHIDGLGAYIYAHELADMSKPFGELVNDTCIAFVRDIIRRMKPRDPLEEMLVVQALWAHARAGHLTHLANSQTGLDQLQAVHEYADRASNTFRRLMLALAEYRRPPSSFNPIEQANFAAQQIVVNQNGKNETKNATNEQGCPAECTAPTAQAPPLLPDAEGPTIVEMPCPQRETVDAQHGTTDIRRQGSLQDERDEARSAIGGSDRSPGPAS